MKPNEKSLAASSMDRDWNLIDALRAGTPGMRAAGKTYLPKRPLEEESEYTARLGVATLFPAFTETVTSMVGRVFAEPLIENEDVPRWIRDEVIPDVDLQGRSLHVFARHWFDEALAYGLSHCLIESPRTDGVQTREQQRAARIRPYLIQISPRSILGWKTGQDGKVSQVRIAWSRTEDVGEFGERKVEQVRVYEPGRVRVFERSDDSWAQVDDIQTGFDGIPLVTLYTGRTGLMNARPPLRELAYLNAKHWAKQSSNDALIDTASVPILAMFGIKDSSEPVVIGAKHAVQLPLGADMKFIEHSGAAIGAGREDLDSLKDEMRQAGAKLLAQGSGQAKTAAQISEESARDNSALGDMVQSLSDALAQVLDAVAAYRGEAKGGTVRLQPNLDPDEAPNDSMRVLNDMAARGMLSEQTVFAESKRRGLVSNDASWEDEQVRIREHGSQTTGAAA